ncbi:SRR1-like protein isoform X2 [Orbicella faveolata]|uniref:SRR1-like protein isoform X2 n=1 Tax=Orbicella faveolata TaxID=48498 RepID=UPI0009E4047B|nr:SRR1-like protein isoform X2 [Orbicella faveolata]
MQARKRAEVSGSDFFTSVRELFYNGYCVDNTSNVAESERPNTKVIPQEPFTDIVCYGIGKLTSCPIARYQFAFLLLLKEFLQIAGQCFIYEPQFSKDDKSLVGDFGCSLIEHNEEGKRKVDSSTLFFMLHCGKPLYNSVLWANWGPGLSNVVILGNRLTSYQERLPSRQLRTETPYIYNILPYMMETPIPNTFHHSDIFNDSAIHWFPTEMLASVPQALWKDNDEPVYDANDPEIVTTIERTAVS